MDYQWLGACLSGAYVAPESLLLPAQLAVAPIVIKPGLANSHDTRILRERNELLGFRFASVPLVRVNAYRGEDMLVAVRKSSYLRKVFQVHTHA
jgi:hypothetical protein